METTLTVDEELLDEAARLTGITEKEEVVRKALTDLIQREAARQLIEMGGTQPDLSPCLPGGSQNRQDPRRRFDLDRSLSAQRCHPDLSP
jgi:hypothetical protein